MKHNCYQLLLDKRKAIRRLPNDSFFFNFYLVQFNRLLNNELLGQLKAKKNLFSFIII